MKRPIKMHKLTQEEIQRVAEDIYIYGYPLLLMDLTKRAHTATAYPTLQSAPLNQFAHGHFLPQPQDKYAVHPNADCLRSSAWLDLHKEPVVLTIPTCHVYYLLSFFSSWYEIFETCSPRTSGTHRRHLSFVSPHWHGRLPPGVTRVASPTETVLIDGWFEVDNPENIESAQRIQSQFHLTPLSEWTDTPEPHSLPFRTDIDQITSPQNQIFTFDARLFYTRLSKLMERSPSQEADSEMLVDFVRIGFLPCEAFSFEMLHPDTMQAMHQAVAAAQQRITSAAQDIRGEPISNWTPQAHPGRFRKNYLQRAVAARNSTDAVLAEDILCFDTAVDQNGESLNGLYKYVIRFEPDLLPPVHAFWSITLYDSRQHLCSNSIHRNVIRRGDRLKLNADNSISIFIQQEWPGEASDHNWLPAPKDAFSLALRLYWPKTDALSGSWKPPVVIRAS
jgi:hypothetical protein